MPYRREIIKNTIVVDWLTKRNIINVASDLFYDMVEPFTWYKEVKLIEQHVEQRFKVKDTKKLISNAWFVLILQGITQTDPLYIKVAVIKNYLYQENSNNILEQQLRKLIKEHWEIVEINFLWDEEPEPRKQKSFYQDMTANMYKESP